MSSAQIIAVAQEFQAIVVAIATELVDLLAAEHMSFSTIPHDHENGLSALRVWMLMPRDCKASSLPSCSISGSLPT